MCNFTSIVKIFRPYIFILLFLVTCHNLLADQLVIKSPRPKAGADIPILYFDNCAYFSVKDFAQALGLRTYNNPETGKTVLFFPNKTVKVTAHSAFIMLDTRILQMSQPAILVNRDDIFVPLYSFLNLLKQYVIPKLQYDLTKSPSARELGAIQTPSEPTVTTFGTKPGIISDIQFEERGNGLTMKISTNATYERSDFSSFFRGDEWFYLTILDATCDSAALSRRNPIPSVAMVEAIPVGNSVQITLKLKQKYDRANAYYDARSGKILVTLNVPLTGATLKKIEEVKNTWIVDTIVIDAGHGGQDSGTPGRWGYKHEKDIVLDIALRLGKLLEQRKDLKVVYTRKTDEFIPLWKRTRLANDSAGKLFISLHINALPSSARGNAEGIELYLQNPTIRTQEAIEVARLENEVIQLETSDDKAKYQDYDNPSHILANMVYNTYLHDSEKFAEILSRNISVYVPQKNRGVKQANFYVLVGASMPNLLCELGYNDNHNDAKKLNDPAHRQKIALALYKSIIEFKEYCDQSVAQSK
ncbi:MAG TPA: N-acetylmuramoyl-L-alanine amidase [Candidatus Marinimicrobia bacterium]|nr:N-acetylmuramoyl-L-alanine amidase [Candidatus Neomarinimicrobiota bacterium]HRU92823.1 N-acetylmuramoyl-L-alanine amidase [Candidatus Neomarinimicrobiota bacterium]